MTQNRKKLIQLLISNLANAIVHDILEQSIDKEELTSKYRKELINSFQIAKKYREKINPIDQAFNEQDKFYIRFELITRVKKELLLRISKGYENINLDLIEEIIDKYLQELEKY
jgi:hypothetical protein